MGRTFRIGIDEDGNFAVESITGQEGGALSPLQRAFRDNATGITAGNSPSGFSISADHGPSVKP